jgi:hypothetical protein
MGLWRLRAASLPCSKLVQHVSPELELLRKGCGSQMLYARSLFVAWSDGLLAATVLFRTASSAFTVVQFYPMRSNAERTAPLAALGRHAVRGLPCLARVRERTNHRSRGNGGRSEGMAYPRVQIRLVLVVLDRPLYLVRPPGCPSVWAPMSESDCQPRLPARIANHFSQAWPRYHRVCSRDSLGVRYARRSWHDARCMRRVAPKRAALAVPAATASAARNSPPRPQPYCEATRSDRQPARALDRLRPLPRPLQRSAARPLHPSRARRERLSRRRGPRATPRRRSWPALRAVGRICDDLRCKRTAVAAVGAATAWQQPSIAQHAICRAACSRQNSATQHATHAARSQATMPHARCSRHADRWANGSLSHRLSADASDHCRGRHCSVRE